tara:strand:+ start:203 stop:451 length:249 start_codon:yes stop_codon:yes gene_type:complete
MENKKVRKNIKIIKNNELASIQNSEDRELSYLLNMTTQKTEEEQLREFAKNYSEENDDELNGLYAHYNIVKKNLNTSYRNLV